DLSAVQERLSAGLLQVSQFLATQAINIGQMTVDFAVSLFVMVYLLFFFLRDGDALARRNQASDAAARGTPARSAPEFHCRHPPNRQGRCGGGLIARRAWRIDVLAFGNPRPAAMGRTHGRVVAPPALGQWSGLGTGRDLFPGDGRRLARSHPPGLRRP